MLRRLTFVKVQEPKSRWLLSMLYHCDATNLSYWLLLKVRKCYSQKLFCPTWYSEIHLFQNCLTPQPKLGIWRMNMQWIQTNVANANLNNQKDIKSAFWCYNEQIIWMIIWSGFWISRLKPWSLVYHCHCIIWNT